MKQNRINRKKWIKGLGLLMCGMVCIIGMGTTAYALEDMPPVQKEEETVQPNDKKEEAVQPDEETESLLPPDTPVIKGVYSDKGIKLTWKKVERAETYYIYKKNNKGKYVKIGQTKKLNYTDKTVDKRKTYVYKVKAVYKKDGKTITGKKSKGCKVWADTIDPNKKMVALTFDDGPGIYTKSIVNCLKKNDARATFFVLGSRVASHEAVVKEAYKIGCEIENHTYSHKNLVRLSEKEIKSQIQSTDQKIKAITGKNPALLRTPGGSISNTVKKAAGKPIILWSIDTRDWEHRNKNKTISSVLNNVKDGDIVLMHDIHEPTKEAALYLIPELKRRGYQLVTVEELAAYRGHTLKKGEVYHRLRKQ